LGCFCRFVAPKRQFLHFLPVFSTFCRFLARFFIFFVIFSIFQAFFIISGHFQPFSSFSPKRQKGHKLAIFVLFVYLVVEMAVLAPLSHRGMEPGSFFLAYEIIIL
jgi:hypothetical protein